MKTTETETRHCPTCGKAQPVRVEYAVQVQANGKKNRYALNARCVPGGHDVPV